MFNFDETNEKSRYQEIIREYKLLLDSTSNDDDAHHKVNYFKKNKFINEKKFLKKLNFY